MKRKKMVKQQAQMEKMKLGVLMGIHRLSFGVVFLVCMAICVPGIAYQQETIRQPGQGSVSRYEYTQIHMGVQVKILFYAPNQAIALRASDAAFARFADIDSKMSDYRKDSELMRLCARAGGPPVRVSSDLFLVIQRALEVANRSNGALDVTVGPYVRLWRKARLSHVLPAESMLRNASKLVGWKKVRLYPSHHAVQLKVKGMQLDLGGIAKGYADDCAMMVLKQHGIKSALIEAGGDIVMSNPPPGADGWKIDVLNADSNRDEKTLTLSRCAISTSGDTEQFILFGKKRYSHIVNPRTGIGLTDRIAATIIAHDGLTSDSLSTAVSVLGSKRGMKLVHSYPGARAIIRYIK
jgi:thiamine biosynthesis lipoprotein